MKQYVGLDVSMEETKIHVLDEEGRQVWRGKCRANPLPSRRPFASMRPRLCASASRPDL